MISTMIKKQANSSDQIIDLLIEKVESDKDFNNLLFASLFKAKTVAHVELNEDLFNALPWPVAIDGYISYLTTFSKWIPHQSNAAAWKKPGTPGHQEVSDRLSHFYWLIDQEVGPGNSKIIERIPWFAKWLVDYAKCLGSFLDTTDSFNQEILESFLKYSPGYRVEDSLVNGQSNNPSGWLTFNQFFARELNPGLRIIANPFDNSIIASPADCSYRAQYKIDGNSKIPKVTIKNTHHFANIEDLLNGSKYKCSFTNGTFVHYFLSPHSYHRFHAPVSGKIQECFPIQGLVYLDVKITNQQFEIPDNSDGGYQFEQARGCITIDTTHSPYGNIGIVAIIPIGMAQVSSVNMIAVSGSEILKGDEFGYFLFGGSDIIVLFQEGVNPQIDIENHYRHYGSEIASAKLLSAKGKKVIKKMKKD